MSSFRHPARLLMAGLALAWSGWFLVAAFNRWSWMMSCHYRCPPFMAIELVPQHMRATDWQTPLLMATLPLAAVGAWCLLRGLQAPKSPRAA